MMALVEDESLPHGPLELLMTVAEEVGLEGANGLDGSLVNGTIFVNLDSEEDGKLTVGCAGSTDTWVRIAAGARAGGRRAVTLSVTASGGLGGHSGTNIQLGRSNAVKVLGRALREAGATVPFRLVSLDGGKSRNAIPRDAIAVVAVAAAARSDLREALEARDDDDPRRLRQDRRRASPRRSSRGRRRRRLDGRGHGELLDRSRWSRPARWR